MAALTDRRPKDSFGEILKIGSLGGVSDSLVIVEDGVGNATPLKLSKTQLAISDLVWPTSGATPGMTLTVGSNNQLEWAQPASTTPAKYDLALSITGKPSASASVLNFCVVDPFTMPSNLVGSVAKSITASTGTAVFTITKNGTEIGSITFSAGSTDGVFTFATAQTFQIGDFIRISAPSTQDSTLANIGITLKGFLVE